MAKYAKISSPIAAWRIIVERHILPVAESSTKRFDAYLSDLMGPGVIATVLTWEPHIKALFSEYVKQATEEKEAADAAKAAAAAAAAAGLGGPWSVTAAALATATSGGMPGGSTANASAAGVKASRLGSNASSAAFGRPTGRPSGRLASLAIPATPMAPATPAPSEPPPPDKVNASSIVWMPTDVCLMTSCDIVIRVR